MSACLFSWVVSSLADPGELGDQVPAIRELMQVKHMGISREPFRKGFLADLCLPLDLAG